MTSDSWRLADAGRLHFFFILIQICSSKHRGCEESSRGAGAGRRALIRSYISVFLIKTATRPLSFLLSLHGASVIGTFQAYKASSDWPF